MSMTTTPVIPGDDGATRHDPIPVNHQNTEHVRKRTVALECGSAE
jgi:hypothetical protein